MKPLPIRKIILHLHFGRSQNEGVFSSAQLLDERGNCWSHNNSRVTVRKVFGKPVLSISLSKRPRKSILYEMKPRRRRIKEDPGGMQNSHTAHTRVGIFVALLYDPTLSVIETLLMNLSTSEGNFFHTCTNIAVDVTKYNEGCDSLENEGEPGFQFLLRYNE